MARIADGDATPPPGLREIKKARTRQAISDIATRLFAQRGFDEVTVAEIAAAAEVSVKTVFNYFASKEDLFFDRADELSRGLVRTIAERPAGTTVTAALRALLTENLVPFPGAGWQRFRDPQGYEDFRAFVRTEHAAPALGARRLVLSAGLAGTLAPVFAREFGLPSDDPRPAVYAAMFMAVMALRERILSANVLEGVAARTVERRVRAAMDDAFARLERAFADLDRPAAG